MTIPFPSPCGVRRVRDRHRGGPILGIIFVSVPLRGKEGAGQRVSKRPTQAPMDEVSVPLRGKEGAGLEDGDCQAESLKCLGFRPLAG